MLGILCVKLDQKLPKNHYSHFTNSLKKDEFECRIIKVLSTNNFDYRYYAKLISTNTNASRGNILLSVDKSKIAPLEVGEEYRYYGYLMPLQGARNPFEFDYRQYLIQQGIHHQIKIREKGELHFLKNNPHFIDQFNGFLKDRIATSKLKPATQNILNTMLLGQGQTMDKNTRQDFANAGVIHLFAISGLHIGLLMLMFQWMLYPLKYLPEGRIVQSIGTLALLWGYAFLIGTSPSVLRSVTLFSCFQLGRLTSRKLPTSYLVLLSMGILLFIHPRFILQLGFQMSYLAVFGILFLQPLLHLDFSSKHLQWFWNLTTVCLAAQIAVAPLSIHHFHQFPLLFLLSNWIILPFIGLFLYLGFGCITLLCFMDMPLLLIEFLDQVVKILLQFVFWVSDQNAFLLLNLRLSTSQLLVCYGIIIGSVLAFGQKKKIGYYLIGLGIIGLQWTMQNPLEKNRSTVWIPHLFGSTLLVEKENKTLIFHSSDTLENHRILDQFRNNINHEIWRTEPLKNAYRIGKKKLYVVDSSWVEGGNIIHQSVILLRKNPKINLERFLIKNSPSLVIIDGSNTPYFIEKWQGTLEGLKQKYWITSQKGAYQFNRENAE